MKPGMDCSSDEANVVKPNIHMHSLSQSVGPSSPDCLDEVPWLVPWSSLSGLGSPVKVIPLVPVGMRRLITCNGRLSGQMRLVCIRERSHITSSKKWLF